LPGSTSTDTITVSPSPTASRTQTLVLPTATYSNTALPGSTFTDTPSSTPSITPSSTFSSTQVLPPTSTGTDTRTPLPSATPTFSSTQSPVPTFTVTTVVPAMITDVGPTAWGPQSLTVSAGTTVTWSWTGFHSVNSTTSSEPYSSGVATTGGSFSHQFNAPGDYTFDSAVDGTVMSGFIHVSGLAGPTNTPSAVPGNGALGIDTGAAWPNPSPKAFSVKLMGPADSLEVKVYTVSEVVVGEFTSSISSQGGWAMAPIPAGFFNDARSGTYYCTVYAKRGSLKSLKPWLGKFVLLK
jgi:plastocyanin